MHAVVAIFVVVVVAIALIISAGHRQPQQQHTKHKKLA